LTIAKGAKPRAENIIINQWSQAKVNLFHQKGFIFKKNQIKSKDLI